MSAATFAAHDQLVTAAYSAAITLIAAIVDPVALESAPLRHRATALNAVSALIGRLHKSKPSPLEGVTHIEWDFGEDDDDGAPLMIDIVQGQTVTLDWIASDPDGDPVEVALAGAGESQLAESHHLSLREVERTVLAELAKREAKS